MGMLNFGNLDGHDAAVLYGDNTAKELVQKIQQEGGIDDAYNAGAEAMAALLDDMHDTGIDANGRTVLESFAAALAGELAAALSAA